MPQGPYDFIAVSKRMRAVLERARLYAATRGPVNLVGETGVGKSLLARHIHDLSGDEGAFVAITAAELANELADSKLFGHAAGAFTSAIRSVIGLFERARNGTLLLDDFQKLPLHLQAKLLRVLSEGLFTPAGTAKDIALEARIIVGLHAPLDDMVLGGLLLPDLRYRLGYCTIHIPPLAERREEIPTLARVFVERHAARQGRPTPRLDPETLALLVVDSWPGNVRQLEEVIRAAVIHARSSDVIEPRHLPEGFERPVSFVHRGPREQNENAVTWALVRAGGDQSQAAELLGVHRNTIAAYLPTRS